MSVMSQDNVVWVFKVENKSNQIDIDLLNMYAGVALDE